MTATGVLDTERPRRGYRNVSGVSVACRRVQAAAESRRVAKALIQHCESV